MLQLANNMGIMPGTTICGLADGAAWPIKNALAKFRAEFEDYIRTHQAPAHEVTGAPGGDRRWAVTPETVRRSCRSLADARAGPGRSLPRDPSQTCAPSGQVPMATIIINGPEHTIPDGREAQRHPGRQAVRGRHPLLLLAPRALGGGQLPDVRDRGRQQGPEDGRDQDDPQARPRLPDPRQGRDRARDRQPQGQGASADDHGVPPDQPPARLPRLRPGRASAACRTTATSTARPTTASSRSGSSTPARTSRTRSS